MPSIVPLQTENPIEIQPASGVSDSSSTPLVLIHDGGGTCFEYHLLSHLDRPVYGIQNPRFESGEPWEGGLNEMAAYYANIVRGMFPQGGSVLLGGWSLGGLLSLQVAHMLGGAQKKRSSQERKLETEESQEESEEEQQSESEEGDENDGSLRVKGIVMLDSVYPRTAEGGQLPKEPAGFGYSHEFGARTRPETAKSVQRAFTQAVDMVRSWELPRWRKLSELQIDATATTGVEGKGGLAPIAPPVVLLRASEKAPVKTEAWGDVDGVPVSRVDYHRDEPLLGWENHEIDFVGGISDVKGHHFSIFDEKHVDELSEKVKEACKQIERGTVDYALDSGWVLRI